MVEVYLLGFAAVWVGIIAVWCVAGIVKRRRDDWSRALVKELLAGGVTERTPTH
jgi:hypothetical protein